MIFPVILYFFPPKSRKHSKGEIQCLVCVVIPIVLHVDPPKGTTSVQSAESGLPMVVVTTPSACEEIMEKEDEQMERDYLIEMLTDEDILKLIRMPIEELRKLHNKG